MKLKTVIVAAVALLSLSAHADNRNGGGTSAIGISPLEMQQILNDAYDAQREVADAELTVKAEDIHQPNGMASYLASAHDAQRKG